MPIAIEMFLAGVACGVELLALVKIGRASCRERV